MSIVKEYGEYRLYCDECGDYQVFNSRKDAEDYRKEEGWKTEWFDEHEIDTCPECVAYE